MAEHEIYDIYYIENCPYCTRALHMLGALERDHTDVTVRRWNVTQDTGLGDFIRTVIRDAANDRAAAFVVVDGQQQQPPPPPQPQPQPQPTPRVTFPQIFVNGHMLIGGSTDLQRWLSERRPSLSLSSSSP